MINAVASQNRDTRYPTQRHTHTHLHTHTYTRASCSYFTSLGEMSSVASEPRIELRDEWTSSCERWKKKRKKGKEAGIQWSRTRRFLFIVQSWDYICYLLYRSRGMLTEVVKSPPMELTVDADCSVPPLAPLSLVNCGKFSSIVSEKDTLLTDWNVKHLASDKCPPFAFELAAALPFKSLYLPPLNRFCRTNHSALCHSVVLRYRERNGYLFRGRTFSLRNVLLETGRKTKALGREEIVVSRLTPCLTNYFPENVPVLTVQFYSKSVHVLIKENTKIYFFFL